MFAKLLAFINSVISVSTSSIVLSASDNQRNQLHSSPPSTVSSIPWIKVFLFAGICAAGWFGWKSYGQKRTAAMVGPGVATGGSFGPAGGFSGGNLGWQDGKRF